MWCAFNASGDNAGLWAPDPGAVGFGGNVQYFLIY